MRMKTFYRLLKTISIIVLFFFVWTFGPVWQAVAFAATNQKANVKAQATGKPETRKQKPEEKFEGVLDAIRANIGKAAVKASKGDDETAEINAIRAGKAEIDSLDAELRVGFADTEKKLKDARLSKEIRDRHAKFVANYESNLAKLKTEIDDIDKAKTKSDRKMKIEKLRLHLEESKPPRRHIPVDPNNLPFKNRKAGKTREPRLKKDDFERDFSQQKKNNKLAGWPVNAAANVHELSRIKHRPIQLAFNDNGQVSDIPLSLGVQPSNPNWNVPQLALNESLPIPLAQATDLPTPDDVAETPEVQLTQEITQLAADLDHNPVKIFNFVRNHIDFVPTYGSIQTAQQTLLTGRGNPFAQSSLLIALLRASGIYAKYEYGTIIVPIEDIKNWTGGFTDANAALSILTNGGIPCVGLVEAGKIAYVRMEHVWVKAWIDYIPSRGAVHKQGDTWINVDPSYKQYAYAPGVDFQSAVPFNAQSFIDAINSTATKNEAEGWVTGVDASLAQANVDAYTSQVNNYISANYPTALDEQLVWSKQIVKKDFPFLPLSLPYTITVKGWQRADLPSSVRHAIQFSVYKDITDQNSETALTYTTSLVDIAGKRITLSYAPATDADKSVLRSFIPQPHPDGSPLQINELPSSLPAYLINLKPELRIDGTVVATGTPLILGTSEQLTVTLTTPILGPEIVNKELIAGDYYATALSVGALPEDALQEKLLDHMGLSNEVAARLTYPAKDQLYGEFLHILAVSYFEHLAAFENLYGRAMGIVSHRLPSFGFAHTKLEVSYFFGIPRTASPKGIMFDINYNIKIAGEKSGDRQKVRDYQFVCGLYSSMLEHAVMEQFFLATGASVDGASTVKILSQANSQNIPIYTITSANISTVLPKLQTGINEIVQNAVNAGKEVITPERNVTINGWTGTGYIVYDPATGNGAYMISGGANGVFFTALAALWIACGEIIYDDDPFLGMEIMQSGINLLIMGQTFIIDTLKLFGNITFDLGMNFVPWGKALEGVGFAYACATSNIVKNGIAGRAFEKIALKILNSSAPSIVKNTTKFATSLGKTIPDAIKGAFEAPQVLWEIKSSMYVCNTGNITKMIELARTRGIQLNLLVKEGAIISRPLQDELPGKIYRFNVITGTINPPL